MIMSGNQHGTRASRGTKIASLPIEGRREVVGDAVGLSKSQEGQSSQPSDFSQRERHTNHRPIHEWAGAQCITAA